MERDPDFMARCEQLVHLTSQLRDDNQLSTACVCERLCGHWVREGASVSFRIYRQQEQYRIETHLSNSINAQTNCVSCELCQDAQGNLYFGILEVAVAYDPVHDRLMTEYYGIFERKKQ